MLLVAGCASLQPTGTPAANTPTGTGSPSPPVETKPATNALDNLGISDLAAIAPTRTPAPKATPHALADRPALSHW